MTPSGSPPPWREQGRAAGGLSLSWTPKPSKANITKSTYLLSGRKKNIERIRAEIEKEPIQYKESFVREKKTEKWLGSIINPQGVRESIMSTIHERTFRVINGIHEIIAIVEDSRSDKLGSLKCAKEIWELALIPVLLNSAETWSVCDSRLFKTLDDFQCKLWRGLLQVPKSCPLPALTYESNSMLMKYKVYSRIVNFVKNMHCQDENLSLCKQIMNEQILNDWPGLIKIAVSICSELKVSGLLDSQINKKHFKANVKRACLKFNKDELLSQISAYKKMSAIQNEVQKGNCYFFDEALQTVRSIFRFRVDLFEAKCNFKNKPEYKNNYLCDSCMSEIDLNTHVLHCPAYASLRQNRNLNND